MDYDSLCCDAIKKSLESSFNIEIVVFVVYWTIVESVSFIYKIFSTESVFYSKYNNLF